MHVLSLVWFRPALELHITNEPLHALRPPSIVHRNNVHIPVQRLIVTRSGIPARPAKMTGQQPSSNNPCRTTRVKQALSNAAAGPRAETMSWLIAAPATRSAKHCGFLLRHPGTGKGSRWFIKWRNGRHAARLPIPIRKNLESVHCDSGLSPRLPLNVLMQHLSVSRASYC